MASQKLLSFLLLFSAAVVGLVQSSCPDANDIKPCYCNEDGGGTVVRCHELSGEDGIRALERLAENSDGFKYREVAVENSQLTNMPKSVFEKIKMTRFVMRHVELTSAVDDIPRTRSDLKELVLQDVKVEEGVSWEFLQNTKGLEILRFDHVHCPYITREFNQYVTHNLKEVHFVNTDTKEIKKDAFKDFRYLNTITVAHNELPVIHRNGFPQPYNGKFIYLPNNNLTEVPEDFFTDMPNLVSFVASGNKITRINEPTEGALLNKVQLDLTGNPIRCDCHLQWVAISKPKTITGDCVHPKQLKGKSLSALTEDDFEC